jgi:hypothetical protein
MADKNTELSIIVSAQNKADKVFGDVAKNLEAYEKKTENLGKGFSAMSKYGAIGFAAISAAVAGSVKMFADAGDALGEMSTKTGISVKSLSELKYALEQNDTDIDTFGVGILQMSKFMTELKSGSDQAAGALKQIGLSVQSVVGLSTEETFLKLGEAVASIDDPMRRVAVATEIFGKQGQNLLPFLEQGSKGIDALRKKAQELGIVMSDKDAKAADEFNNSLNSLKAATQGATYAFGSIFLPTLNSVVNKVIGAIQFVKDLTAEHPRLVYGITLAAGAMFGLTAAIGIVGMAVIGLTAVIGALMIPLWPLIAVIGAVGIAAGVVGATMFTTSKSTDAMSDALSRADGALDKTGDSFIQMSQKAEDTKKKIIEIRKEISQLVNDAAKQDADSRAGIGELFVEQEQKVADLETDIESKKQEIKKAKREEGSRDHLDQLRTELSDLETQHRTEQAALLAHQGVLKGMEAEYQNAKRRAELTEFERRLEDSLLQRKQNLEDALARIQTKQLELAELEKQEIAYTAVIQREQDKQVKIVEDATSKILASMEMRTEKKGGKTIGFSNTGGVTTPAAIFRASGGPVSGGRPYVVGEEGPEMFVPSSNGSIVPNSRMGGTTINILGGTYLSEDAAESLGDMIISRLKLSNAL